MQFLKLSSIGILWIVWPNKTKEKQDNIKQQKIKPSAKESEIKLLIVFFEQFHYDYLQQGIKNDCEATAKYASSIIGK